MPDKEKSNNHLVKTPVPPKPSKYREGNSGNGSASIIHNGKIVSKDRPTSKPPVPKPSK